MKNPIPITLAVEDDLSEAVLRALLGQQQRYLVGNCHGRTGFGYLRKNIAAFNNMARTMPILVLTDLDRHDCAPGLIADWLSVPQNPDFIFRVAVREVEAWVLAHREAFAKFVGIRPELIPADTDAIDDPKKALIDLVKKSRQRNLKDDIVPAPNSTAQQGRNYNEPLVKFVNESWNAREAAKHSESLRRAIRRLSSFQWSKAR